MFFEPGSQRRRRVEIGTDLRLAGTLAHHPGVATLAKGKRQGVDEDGLARAGFAGQNRKSGRELKFKRFDDDKIANGEKAQHLRGTPDAKNRRHRP